METLTASKWKVEGKGPLTKIVVSCPLCNSGATLRGDDPKKVIRERFKHNGCKGRLEAIPEDIRDEYWKRAIDEAALERFRVED